MSRNRLLPSEQVDCSLMMKGALQLTSFSTQATALLAITLFDLLKQNLWYVPVAS